MCYRITIYSRMKVFINTCNVENCTHNSWMHKFILDLPNAKKISQIVCKERQQFWYPVIIFFIQSQNFLESLIRIGKERRLNSNCCLPEVIDGPSGAVVKNPSANTGDTGSIPGSGRSPGERNGNLLQCYCLENSMDRRAQQATVHGVTKTEHAYAALC